jgi:glutathione peroxidase
MKYRIRNIIVLGICTVFFSGMILLSSDQPVRSIYDFKMTDIDGKVVSLEQYKGQVVMIVNVASKCGLTPQYEGLQKIYTRFKDRGFVILGFPANNFRKQEPGTDAEIKSFCTVNYGVEFPMFSKISVLGDDMHPLYRFLTGKETNPGFSGDIRWNFDKFLFSKEGKVVARFHPKVKPDSDKIIQTIETELKK